MAASSPLETLYLTVAVILAMSMASERLVEIVKGAIPWLNQEIPGDPKKESWRKMAIQLLAVVAGLVTAFLGQDAIASALNRASLTWGQLVGLGILSSGGSSLWNSVLVYLLNVKNLKEAQAVQLQSAIQASGDPNAQQKILSGT